MFLKLIHLILLINLVKSQTTPQIDFGFKFDERIFGSNLRVPVLFNQNKPLGSQTKLQCLIQQFNSIDDYNKFENLIISSTVKCPSRVYNGITNITLSSFVPSQSNFTYNGQSFDWYFNDTTKDNTKLYKLNEFVFKDTSLDYLTVNRYPFNSLKIDYVTYLSVFCCDSTYLDISNIPQGQFVYNYKLSRFIVTVPVGLDASLIYPPVPTTNDLLDPSYKPCNCDLTLNACDLNCCCDSSCTQDDKNTFSNECYNTKNFTSREIEDSFCDDIYSQPKLNKTGWFPILCVHSSTTVLLGKFYSPDKSNSIDFSSDQFKKNLQSLYNIKSAYLDSSLSIKDSTYCNSNYKNSYSYGTCLKIISTSDNTVSDFLRLPESYSSNTNCIVDSPTRYLVDKKSYCPININQYSCSNNALLNTNNYLLNGLLIDNPNNQNKVNVLTQVYSCSYSQIFTFDSINDLVKACGSASFSAGSKIFDQNLANLCFNYNWTYDSTRINNIPTDYFLSFNLATCVNLSNTAFNTPIFSNNVCQNSVFSVRNVYFWNGGTISKLLQQIIVLKDSPIDKRFYQYFETDWIYSTSSIESTINSVSDYDKYRESGNLVQSLKSGINGYIDGKPLISGYYNPGTLNIPNIGYNQRISFFKSLNKKLCGTYSALERKLINFKQNTSSSCIIQLTRNDLTNKNNCNALRKIIFNKLNDYFAPANLISKNGNPNMNAYNSSDWITLYPISRSLNVIDSDSDLNKCLNIPYRMSMYFFYSPVSKYNDVVSYEIIGAYATYSTRNWTFVCKSSASINCYSNNLVQDYEIQFQTYFINNYSKNMSWLEKCKTNSQISEACLQQVFFTWPNDPTNPDYFYLYSVHLGLLFGVFSFIVIYVMIIGFVCPC